MKTPEISIILPCRNEEESLDFCLRTIKQTIKNHKLNAEIIVSDSSTDNSPEIAKKHKVKLIKHNKKGYGIAYLEAFKKSKGKYIFMADSDGSYDFKQIPKFIKYLEKGYDFVIGDRFKGKIQENAMPFSHKYFGNPILSFLLRLFYKTKVNDAHCGIRAITKKSLDKLNLQTTGMEFASEMIVKALQNNLKIKEIPINYYKRKGNSKLKSFSDGWRHLRFMLMYAPNYLFIIPGILLTILGIILILTLKNNVVYGCFSILIGYQIISLGIYTKTHMKSLGLIKSDKLIDSLAKIIKFETGIYIALIIILLSLLLKIEPIFNHLSTSLSFPPQSLVVLGLTISIIGIQTMFSAFFISIQLVSRK